VIHLEHAQRPIGVGAAIGERVEPGTQQDVLPNPCRNATRKLVLDEAAARDQRGPKAREIGSFRAKGSSRSAASASGPSSGSASGSGSTTGSSSNW
jgi:hypothetical protein